jgi:multidrug efflux pump subunit AcrA (membrane-fusion protein)
VFGDQGAVVEVLRGNQEQRAVKRAAFVVLPLVTAVIVGTTVLVAHGSGDQELTLSAKVEEGQVSKMLTAKGVVSAATTANLNFQLASAIRVIDVKVGDKVKKGQKLGEQNNGARRRAVLQAQQALAQQQAALDLLLNDVNPRGLERIYERWKQVADQAHRNVELKENADRFTATRSERAVRLAEKDLDKKRDALRTCENPAIPVPPPECGAQKTAYDTAKTTLYNARTTMISNWKAMRVNRGLARSTYRAARKDAITAYNTWNIARVNRPNQILAARAQVANALVAVGNAQGGLSDSFIYAPIDGVVSAIAGTVGEFNPGGNNLTPNTPLAPGGTARIPTVGDLAGLDQKNLTGGQGPNLGLQAVLPGGNTFMQLTDVSAFQVVAAFPQNDVPGINPGDKAKVTLDSLSGKVLDGAVTAISPVGTPGANGAPMYYATVMLDKDQVPDSLKSGLTGSVSVVTSTIQPKAMVVPTSAVTEDDGHTFVEVPGVNGTHEKRQFTRGKVGDDNTEVLGGLKQGDAVLVPSNGLLPTPANDTAPAVPTDKAINFDQGKAPDTKPDMRAPVAVPPAPMVAPSDTYPGDAGELADESAPNTGPAGNPNAGLAGTNPFAPINGSGN